MSDTEVITSATENAPSVKTAGGLIVFIGDSLIRGANSTGINNGITGMFERLEFYTDWFLKHNQVAYTVVNAGVDGQNSTQIAARFAADVLALDPAIVVIEAGIADVTYGVDESVFLANWTAMLDAAQAQASVEKIMAIQIGPSELIDDATAEIRDAWNVDHEALVASYSKARIVRPKFYLGEDRPSGPVGNLWDIQDALTADGLHRTNAGYCQDARAVYDAM